MSSLEYAQARIQARHGKRPAEAAWSPLHSAIDLASLLDMARAGPLEGWVAGLEPSASATDLEQRLHEQLRRYIAEVASWMPAPWQPAVLWTRALADLAPHTAQAREAWAVRWRELWPARNCEEEAALETVALEVRAHFARFAVADIDEAWPMRAALQARLTGLFRRFTLTPAAAFAHLLLVALDLERLRAELVGRAAFPVP